MENLRADEHLVDLWFSLKDRMMGEGMPNHSSAIRPPALRDAAYAYALGIRNGDNPPAPEIVESFVNGLELGALGSLRIAWAFWTQHGRGLEAPKPLDELIGKNLTETDL